MMGVSTLTMKMKTRPYPVQLCSKQKAYRFGWIDIKTFYKGFLQRTGHLLGRKSNLSSDDIQIKTKYLAHCKVLQNTGVIFAQSKETIRWANHDIDQMKLIDKNNTFCK